MDDDDISAKEICDALPYAERARILVDRLTEAYRRGASGAELGDLYVALVSALFADLATERWPVVHERLVAELGRDPGFPMADIWDAIERRYVE